MVSIDPNYPVFVLAFCIFPKRSYARKAAPAVLEFKFKHFGHDQVVLHEHDIRKNKGPFLFLRDASKRDQFMADLDSLVANADFTLVASAIDKNRHRARYAAPFNPYHIAMGFGLERVFRELSGRGCVGGTTYILFERRGSQGRRRSRARVPEDLRRERYGERSAVRADPGPQDVQLIGSSARGSDRPPNRPEDHRSEAGEPCLRYDSKEVQAESGRGGEGVGLEGISIKAKGPGITPRPDADRECPVHLPVKL